MNVTAEYAGMGEERKEEETLTKGSFSLSSSSLEGKNNAS